MYLRCRKRRRNRYGKASQREHIKTALHRYNVPVVNEGSRLGDWQAEPTQKNADRVMDKLNNIPRQYLGFKTPNQVFLDSDSSIVF